MSGLWPVIGREMRGQSRAPATYWTRVATAACGILAGAYLYITGDLGQGRGIFLFLPLHWILQLFLWIIVPITAADCISQERREGTLALLFLTPLRPFQIVLAKSWVHGMRAVSIGLSVMPILAIASLLGGVDVTAIVCWVFLTLSAVLLSLGAGILGSVFSKSWSSSILYALCLSFVFFGLLAVVIGLALGINPLWKARFATGQGFAHAEPPSLVTLLDTAFDLGARTISMFPGAYVSAYLPAKTMSLGAYLHSPAFLAVAAGFCFSILFLLLIVLFATWVMRRTWRELPPSARMRRIEATLLKPVIGVNFLKAWLKRTLDRNPVGWLELRSWSGRSVSWAWFAVMISVYSYLLGNNTPQRMIGAFQTFISYGFLTVICGNAAASFYRERENRAMELLLVSPLTPGDIMFGRLRALWSRFLPALVVLVSLWLYLPGSPPREDDLASMLFVITSYFAVPVIGLYYSLRCANFLSAFACTAIVGLLFPAIGSGVLVVGMQIIGVLTHGRAASLFQVGNLTALPVLITFGLQAAAGFYLGGKMHAKLKKRDIAFIRRPAG